MVRGGVCSGIIPIKYYAWMMLDICRTFLYIIPKLRNNVILRGCQYSFTGL